METSDDSIPLPPATQHVREVRMHGKEYSSDSEGDGPVEINGVRLVGATSYELWKDFYQRNMRWNGRALYTSVMAFDKHNVI